MSTNNPYLKEFEPVKPFPVEVPFTVSATLQRMAETSFQARSLGTAFQIWRDALKDETTVFFGLSGAMVPAGMRKVIVSMIQNRYIDAVVSTGANLFHDVHETLGRKHYKCSPNADDVALFEHNVDRMYDVAACELEFEELDRHIGKFVEKLEKRPYTTREFFHLFGKSVAADSREDGIVSAAAKAGIPVYCPAIGDSSYGISLAVTEGIKEFGIIFDVIKDVKEMGMIVAKSPTASVVFVGGGTPKNFTQQAEVTARLMNEDVKGYKYCIQLTTDAPHWGGLSGCTFEESQSWGKIHKRAEKVAAYVDATIGLPLLVSGLAEVKAEESRKFIPVFRQGKDLGIEFPSKNAKGKKS